MALKPTNAKQVPEHSIMDFYNKQTYLGQSFLISTGLVDVSSANTETPILLLQNPSSNFSSGSYGQKNIGLFQNVRKLSQGTNVSSATTLFRFYLNPTAPSPGSAATISNLRPSFSNSSKMNAYVSPTISSNGAFLAVFSVNYQEIDSSVLFILDPGYSILLTAETDTASTYVIAELSWYEL